MATEFEEKRREDKRQRAYANRRAIMDYGMGLIYTAMGVFFLFSEQFGVKLEFPAPPFSYIFAGLCLIYGGFRIYRGYKKNYFR
jgi:hypothetical protein